MQSVAYAMGEEEPVKGGDNTESTNTANNARTYCFEECCAPMAMDLCGESAANEVTRSTKISRAEWTAEEHAAGHAMVEQTAKPQRVYKSKRTKAKGTNKKDNQKRWDTGKK
jgi:hypothetical protein